MAGQGPTSGLLDQVFGSDALKAALALVTVLTTIVKYIKEAGQRRARAASVSERYRLSDLPFWIVVRIPAILHQAIAIGALVVAVIEIAFLTDVYAAEGNVLLALPAVLSTPIEFISSYFVPLFIVAFAFYIAFELRALEFTVAFFTGLFPSWRETLGWSNAQWQIKSNDSERRILVPSGPNIDSAASRIIDEICSEKRNNSLALKPIGLDEDVAANILFFGHVFEAYGSAHGERYGAWTAFYEALADISKADDAPFTPATILAWPEKSSYHSVLLRANDLLDEDLQISNSAGLETAIETALSELRGKWKGDARNFATGMFGTDYDRVLSAAAAFLDTDGMRRQFAKLFILWNLKPGATRPSFFRVPFNANMFIRYLDDGVIRSEGDSFRYQTGPVQICFELVQREILSKVLALVDQSKDAKRAAFREKEKASITSRDIDWIWWIHYLADTQAYRDAREHQSTSWKVVPGEEITRIKD